MQSDITVNDIPLSTYLGETSRVKEQAVVHRKANELRKVVSAKQPIYRPPVGRHYTPTQEIKNGPVIIKSRREIMEEKVKRMIMDMTVYADKVIAVLMIGRFVSTEDIYNILKSWGDENLRLATVRTIMSTALKVPYVKDRLSYKKKGKVRYFKWTDDEVSLELISEIKEMYALIKKYKTAEAAQQKTATVTILSEEDKRTKQILRKETDALTTEWNKKHADLAPDVFCEAGESIPKKKNTAVTRTEAYTRVMKRVANLLSYAERYNVKVKIEIG